MKDLPKSYEPKLVEEKWYKLWEENNFFTANAKSQKPPFCIVIPPPNVTGVLHMGHALVNTLQDVLIRWKRMSGFEALWVPGTDHAGIATQTVVERDLIAKTGKKRKDFSREEFLQHVWDWKERSEKEILQQLRRLGSSCDWSRLRFTMDEQCSKAVRVVFKKMFDENLIYRGDYLVNWDPVTQTALADDEVEYEEQSSFLWHFRYPLEDGSGYIVVATTRPETMLGDVAIAYSPKDKKHENLAGKNAVLPLVGRTLSFIADHHVDPEFGTGLVKVTPGHDPNDYEMGIRHGLEMINIMTPEGKINDQFPEFAGLTMQEARMAVVKRMQELKLVEKIEPHTLRVGVSYRSKAIIEPYLSKQWFVRMSAFKEPLLSAVKNSKVRLIPKNFENTYFHWIENLRDWCISRQLWWGHQIPIWYNKEDPSRVICHDGLDTPSEVKAQPDKWVQEEDVLDTWFSSALWPFSVLGYPEKTPDLAKFYPNSTLITGHDILFFWVARMIMMGEYVMGEVPFPETFLHGLIYGKSYWRYNKNGSIAYASPEEKASFDRGAPLPSEVRSKWEKMSKSKGNIIDPLEMIDMYGTDATRMALCASANQNRQIDLDVRKFEEFKNFANKVWNGARFVFMNLESLSSEELSEGVDLSTLLLEDKWILSLLGSTISRTNKLLEEYSFDIAATTAYDFFWKDFCAYYLEIAKPILFGKKGSPLDQKNKQKILVIVLTSCIRLLHPMTPFITEEIFSLLKDHFSSVTEKSSADVYTKEAISALQSPRCIVAPYPTVLPGTKSEEVIEYTFQFMQELIYGVRNIRAEMQLAPNLATDLFIVGKKENANLEIIKNHLGILHAMVRVNEVHFVNIPPQNHFSATSVLRDLTLLIPLPEELKEKEFSRLTKEKEKLILQQNGIIQKLGNPEFVQKAPEALVQKYKINLEQTEKELVEISKKLNDLRMA